MMGLIGDACAPVAIVGSAGWNEKAAHYFARFAGRIGLPVASAFRCQDSIPNSSRVWAGNLGYGPNPQLARRIREADLLLFVGARLDEATSEGYELVTPDHPDQILVQIHPDPLEFNKVYRADLSICADMGEFAEAALLWSDDIVPFDAGPAAHEEWLAWSTPQAGEAALDLPSCVGHMREVMPADTVICNGAGNFSSWWHRYWRYEGFPSELAPMSGAMGYGVPAAIAASLRLADRPVVALAGDGDFMMNGQELATAVRYGCDMIVILVDNGGYGTIRMHQELHYPGRVSGTGLTNPDFAALAAAYGAWSARVETTAQFSDALAQARERTGVRLLHLIADMEYISASGHTISDLRTIR